MDWELWFCLPVTSNISSGTRKKTYNANIRKFKFQFIMFTFFPVLVYVYVHVFIFMTLSSEID